VEKINTLFQPILLPITALLFIGIITNTFLLSIITFDLGFFMELGTFHILDVYVWVLLNIFWFLHITWMCDATISEVSKIMLFCKHFSNKHIVFKKIKIRKKKFS
jgi:hypothetical protein